ncbi:DUF2381 family protein [Corallococcus terminator]
MLQPLRLALALVLVAGAAAAAEPLSGGRVRRERSVSVAGPPAEPLPVIHVAGDTWTVLLFSAPIQKKSLTFDESRIRVLDAGERSVIVQPLEDLQEGERQELGVFFADGGTPARAVFVLVTAPGDVDSRITVQRPEPRARPCEADAEPPVPKPEDFLLLGYMDDDGVTTSSVPDLSDEAQGLASTKTVSYRGKGWVLVDVTITNMLGQPAWTPREATFTRRVGLPLRARLVPSIKGAIAPGEEGRVLVVVETPAPKANQVFTVELRGDGGRRLKIPDVRFLKSSGGKDP